MIRWGFLGAGFVATQALAPAVHAASGASLQAVAARSRDRAAALGPVTAYDDYAAVLADPLVDAVYISLTNEQHLPWAVAAMRAGKAVLCEKPLALTAAEVLELTAVSAQTGQLLVEASWYRWHPRVLLAQATLAQIGPVQHVCAGFTFAGELAGNYRLDPQRGGGALYDVGCYAVSACLWAVGRGLPDAVTAQAVIGPSGVDLATQLLLDWDGATAGGVTAGGVTAGGVTAGGVTAGGVTAEVQTGIDREQGQWLVITGAEGVLELRDAPYTAWKNDVTQLWISDGRSTRRVGVPATDAYQLMVENISSVLAGGAGWVLPLAESSQTAAVLDAGFASLRQDGVTVCLS